MALEPRSGGLIRPYEKELGWLARFLDVLWIPGALWLSLTLYGYPWTERYTLVATGSIVLFYLFGEGVSLYRSWRSEPLRSESAHIALAWIAVAVGILFIGYATKTTHEYSRLAIGTWFLLASHPARRLASL